jgi:hypothetical protein
MWAGIAHTGSYLSHSQVSVHKCDCLLWKRKLRLSEIKKLAQGHIAGTWQIWGWSPGVCSSRVSDVQREGLGAEHDLGDKGQRQGHSPSQQAWFLASVGG